MTDTTELDAAWADAPTRLLVAILSDPTYSPVARAAAARLQELDAEIADLYQRNGELNDQLAALKSAPAPVAAPAATAPAVAPEPPAAVVPWVPTGWKLVPIDPTDEMANAARSVWLLGTIDDAIRAAIDASPPPPPGEIESKRLDAAVAAIDLHMESPADIAMRAAIAAYLGVTP